jgi:hypothetical protein
LEIILTDQNIEIQKMFEELNEQYKHIPSETRARIIHRFIKQKFFSKDRNNTFEPVSLDPDLSKKYKELLYGDG